MKKFLSILFVFAFISAMSQDRMLIRISNPSENDLSLFLKENYDVAAFKPREFIDLVVNQAKYQSLKNEGYQVSITQTEQQLKENLKSETDLTGYRDYDELLADLQAIEASNPAICKLYDIGDTRGKEYTAPAYDDYKHDIWALKVSDNVATEEDEPCIFYMGTHHAREPISLEVAMYILNHIVDNYGIDPVITNSVNNKQIWFVPLVNPNGHKIVWDEVDTWWRKNIRDNNNSNTINTGTTDGVDPNRNYGWEWGGQGTSSDPTDITYCGPSPFSEPETMAMKSMLDSHHFVAGISYHSYSELVLFPFGYAESAFAPDHSSLEELAIDMATTIPASGGGTYTPEKSSDLYPASGVTDDYAYGQHGIFSYTIELGTTFIPAANQILGICEDNLEAAMILLNRSDHSTLTGLVKNANTLLPVAAEVYVDGIDNTGAYREPYRSSETFGRYYRLLQDGNYTVTFSAYGYISQTFNNVNINNLDQTLLDVFLVPAQTVTVTGTVTDMDTGLPIENASIEVLNTPLVPVTTDQYGNYTITNIMEGTFDFRVYAMDYATIIEEKIVSVANNVFDFQLQESFAWSFETGVFEPQWIFGGDSPWFITTTNPYDGLYCSQSGAIGNNSTSEMEITLFLSSGGDISFFRKVSSESSYDFLEFYIDDVLQNEWSGELDWAEVSFPVADGEHAFKWVYSKDQSVSNGSDCGWIDYIIFPPIIPPPDPAEIALSPLSFEVTLAADGSTVEELNIANTGEMDLGFELLKSYLSDGSGSKDYCVSVGGGGDEFIENVTIGTINNTTSQSDYADYTSLSTTVNIGESYPITITNGDPIWSSDQCGIWVDWNQNEDFSDDTPIVVSGTPGVGPYTANIVPPVDALGGPTRMRVQIIYAATPDPCVASFSYGEVEDYTLIVNSNFSDWLTLDPTSGTVGGSDNTNINLTFDATDLEIGDYFADVIINSNDPINPQLIVPCTLHVADQISVDLTTMLEGPYAGYEMQTTLNTLGELPLNQPFNTTPWNYSGTESVAVIPNADVVDWVLIELRQTAGDASTAIPATIIGRQAGLILKDGSIVDMDGISLLRFDLVVTQNLFAVVYHRNHIGIMSASPLVNTVGTYTLNFSSAEAQAYGGSSSQKEIAPGVWAMFAGDADGNGTVNMDDKLLEWQTHAGSKGFLGEDYNLDGQVDNQDKDDCWLINNGKTSYIPY